MFQMLFSWKFCWKRCISPLSSTSTPWILHKECSPPFVLSLVFVSPAVLIPEAPDIYEIMLFIASSYMRTRLFSFMFGPICPFDEEDDHTDCIVEDDPCVIIGIWMFMNHGSLCLPVYSGRLYPWYYPVSAKINSEIIFHTMTISLVFCSWKHAQGSHMQQWLQMHIEMADRNLLHFFLTMNHGLLSR